MGEWLTGQEARVHVGKGGKGGEGNSEVQDNCFFNVSSLPTYSRLDGRVE